MKNKNIVVRFLLGFYLVMFIIPFFMGIINGLFNINLKYNTETLAKADGFTIEEYNIILDVKEDNKIDVTENITVNFTKSNKHGIYKFTPLWLEYTGLDGKTIKRKSRISNYRAIGDPYTIDTVKKKARIKIGSASTYVKKGEKTYVIKYTYDMGSDPYKGFDELIFHAYGDYWGTEIKNASIEINMPKSIEGYNINFFTDKYRKENVNDIVEYTVIDNKLIAVFNSLKSDKPLTKSLTVDIELPEGYFKKGSWNYGYGSLIISIIIIVLTIYTIYKWVKYGKDYKKRVQTIEFYPPDDLSSAEIGYVYNKNQANKKLTISLIISLASKGYIKIDDTKLGIVITNLTIKPKDLQSFEQTLPVREIEVQKLKNIDNNLSKDEITIMKYLFRKSNTKILKSNIEKFLDVKDGLVNKGYIQILNDNEELRLINVDEKRKKYDEKKLKYDEKMNEYNDSISKLKPLTRLEQIVYNRLFSSKDSFLLSDHHTFYQTFDEIADELNKNFKNKIHDEYATKQMKYSLIRNVIILILTLISYGLVEDLDPRLDFLYLISFLCNLVNFFFTLIMKRKTDYGEIITARVKGFRNFLMTCEKEQLENLVEQDPKYFYNILPYTYVLNVSKKWVKKFENIKMPEIDMGTFDYNNSFSLYHDVYYPAPTYSSSSSGCSSCGGGCSSCGGGCSSCGGGGSW